MKLQVICKGRVDEKIGRLYPFMVRVEEYGKPRDYHFETWEGVVEWVRVRDEHARYNPAFEAISAVGFRLRHAPEGTGYQICRVDGEGPVEWFETPDRESAFDLARTLRNQIDDEQKVSAEVELAFDAMRKKGGPIVWVGGDEVWARPSTYAFN
jgi:hypothetical protein